MKKVQIKKELEINEIEFSIGVLFLILKIIIKNFIRRDEK